MHEQDTINGRKSVVTQVSLAKGERVETKVLKSSRIPSYRMTGNGTMNKHGIKSIDLLKEVMSMTKAEQLVINTLIDNLEWNNPSNEAHIPLSRLLSKSNITVFKKGFKLLKEKNLVARTKLGHYMLNPDAYIPGDYERGKLLWSTTEPREKPTEEEQK